MPNVNIDMTGRSAGDEISSTNEGRYITVMESALTHPTHADGFVDGGDCVLLGNETVGVALSSAAAATDYITIDTEGIFAQVVQGINDAGNSAVAEGDEVYINRTTCVLSKVSNFATHQPFGYALSPVVAGVLTTIVAVKVHFDPAVLNQTLNYTTTTSGSFGLSLRSTLAGGASEGMTTYLEGHLSAVQTGLLYNLGSWINVDDADFLNGSIVTPFDGGIWSGTSNPLGRVVFAGQHMAILNDAPASLHAWRLNTTQTITALIAAANPGSIAYSAGTAGTGVVGTVPLFDAVGPGLLYIDVHAAVA